MIAVEGLKLRQGAFALDGVTFTIPTGTYAALMGRTGSGKTTILETIVGFRRPSAGTIRIHDRDVTAFLPAARAIGYVPQDAVLFKTMTVYDNIAFALAVRKTPPAEIDKRVKELAEKLGVAELLKRQAVGLSGGESQRIALGRALAFRPHALLLDEPLNAVDEETRERLVELLGEMRREKAITVLHVTHNRAEAEQLSDMILRLEAGRVTVEETAK